MMRRLFYCLLTLSALLINAAFAVDDFYMVLGDVAEYRTDLGADCHEPNLDDSHWPQMSLREISEHSHYCVRLKVNLAHQPEARDMRLWTGMLASREIYWDGQLLGSSGQVGFDRVSEIPGPVGQSLILLPSQLNPGIHLLSMQVSTHHHQEDLFSIFYGVILAEQKVLQKFEEDNTLISMAFAGALLLLFVLFTLLYWLYQRDKAIINFSMLCLFSAVLIGLEVIKFHYAYPWDWHVIRLRTIIAVTLITAMYLISFYCYYYRFKFAGRLLILSFITLLVLAFIGPSYDYKSILIFLMTMLICLGINVYAVRRRQTHGQLNLAILVSGVMLLMILPFSFIEKWFAAIFSVIAIVNLYSLVRRFAKDREKALLSLRLESELLRRNIQPHFLMNSLMLIVEWIETQPELAVKFVEALAEEFRLLNEMSKKRLVSLTDELNLCSRHLSIMEYRYQKKLNFQVRGEPEELKIPPAVLHTLIENAFSHNRIENGDQFKVAIKRQQKHFQILVEVPFRPRKHGGSGTGEEYIRSRFEENFSSSWKLKAFEQHAYWISELTIPYVSDRTLQEASL